MPGRRKARVNGFEVNTEKQGGERAWGEEHGGQRPDRLGVELLLRRRAQQEPDAEVGRQLGRDVARARGQRAGDQVDRLRLLHGRQALGRRDAAEDQLRRLGRRRDGRDVGDAAAVDGQEGEDEGEQARQHGEPRAHVELDARHDAGQRHHGDHPARPHPAGDLLFGAGRVLDQTAVACAADRAARGWRVSSLRGR